MHETGDDLRALQQLLDRSYDAAGEHLRRITTPERRLDADDVSSRLTGMCLLALAGRLQPAVWTVRVAVERRDGDITIIVPSTDRSDTLSVGEHRHIHELARSLGGRLDVIGHPDSHAGLHVRLPQLRAEDR